MIDINLDGTTCLALSIAVTRWPVATSVSPEDVDPLEEFVKPKDGCLSSFFLWLWILGYELFPILENVG